MEEKEAITEELFREAYEFEEEKKKSFKKVLAESLKCSKAKVLSLLPFVLWISYYSPRNDLLKDLVAGVTVAVMHIPHGLAYAPLGKVEPVVGLYMAVFPVIIYFFLGTSRHLSIGTFAVVCAMVGEIVFDQTGQSLEASLNMQNDTLPDLKYQNIEVATAMCFMVGVWQAGLGLLQLGSFSAIMSESFVSGYTSGAAVHVFSFQLKNLFGIHMGNHPGMFKLFYVYKDFFRFIHTVNLVTMSISIICISILLFFNMYVKNLLQRKFPKNKIPVPMELLIIVSGILLSYFLQLSKNYDVRVVGNIPSGFPDFTPPRGDIFAKVIKDSFVVALVTSAINLSLAKIFAKQGFYKVSNNHEFFAYGMANIFSSFFLCLPSAASLSRTTIQFRTGGKSQVASTFSMVLILFILLFAGPLFEPVPYCVLSSLVVVSLQGLLMQIIDFPRIFYRSRSDGVVWLSTFLAVVFVSLDIGLFVGLFLSGVAATLKAHSYKVLVLGRVPETNIYLSLEHYLKSQEVPKILILQLVANMNFVNSAHIVQSVIRRFQEVTSEGSSQPECVVICMSSLIQVDPTGVNELLDLYSFFQQSNCDLYFTDCNTSVYTRFEVCKMFKTFPKEHVLATVADAIDYLISLEGFKPEGQNAGKP